MMHYDRPYDLTALEGMTPGQMLLKIRKDLEFAMPPRGLTRSHASLGGLRWERVIWRCEVEGCWYVATPSSDVNLDEIKRVHETGNGNSNPCPSPPLREELPSGLSEVEKLWREIDDVVDAILSGVPYRAMETSALSGYVKGLAFSIVMKDSHHFPNIKAVSVEARERWKMRKNDIPWRPTPTTQAKNWTGMDPAGGWKPTEPVPTSKPPAKKAAPRKAVPVSPEVARNVRFALQSGMLDDGSIAQMYGVPLEYVQRLKSVASK
jgi:hypothetical protein